MKTLFNISAVAVFLVVASSVCSALWVVASVSREQAKKSDIQVRSTEAGPNHVNVELECNAEGESKNLTHVDLTLGKGDNLALTVPLREDRSKPGRLVVSFRAATSQLDKLTIQIRVPNSDGGMIYELQVKDFVEVKKGS